VSNGEEALAGKNLPALHFGATEMNNNFVLVDEVQKEMGGTATIVVKNGDEFVRVATNVRTDDGSRAIGTILDPKGNAIGQLRTAEAISERPTSWASLTSLAMNQSAMQATTSSASITSAI
jgi:Cache 3/Cache 2 fusion domain